MNIIDALFITLSLDTREYEKKQKGIENSLKKFGEASDKQTKLIAEGAKKAANAFSALKIEVLGAIAAYGLGDGIKGFIESNVAGNAALGRMSRNLRMSASDLKAWGYAAQSVGGKAEDATNALQSVAKGIADAKLHGSSQLILASNRYGVGISGNDTPEQALLKINRALYAKAQRYGAQQAMAIAGDLGIDNFYMQQLLMRNPDRNQQALAHYRRKTGNVDTKDAIAFQGTLTDIRADIGNLRDDLFAKMAPAMEVFATKFEAYLDKITPKLEALVERFSNWLASLDWQKVIDGIQVFMGKVQAVAERITNWLANIDWKKVIGGIETFIGKVQAIVKEMGGWKTVAEILGAVLVLKVLAPVLTMTSALVQMVSLFAGATSGVAGLTSAFGSLGLAVAAAAAAGGIIGHEIWKHLLEGTKAGDAVGSFTAQVMAQLGSKEAQDAVNRANGKGPQAPSYYHPERTDWYKSKQAQAIQFFQSQGFSRNAAIGMAANIARESSFNQQSVGDNGQAYGIGQWHPDRQANFARVMGLPIQASSYQQQLAFYAYEVKHNKRLMGILSQNPNAGAAAMAVSFLNERPADAEAEAQRRALIAQNMVNAHGGAPRGSQTAGTKTSTSSSEVHIGTLNVQTKATDAVGVAKGMQKALIGNPLIRGSVTALA